MPDRFATSIASIASWAIALVGVVCVGCDTDDTAGVPAAPDAAVVADPAATPDEETPATPPEPEPTTEPDRVVDKTFDDIKFDIEPDAPFDRSMLTDDIEKLAGERIRIRGWMLPTFQRSDIKQFVLVRDNQECCFGPGAALYDCIVVDMVDGAAADFSTRAIAVEGTFSIEELVGPDGKHLAVYHLQADEAG